MAKKSKKKALAAGLVICCGTAGLYAKPQVLFGIYPGFSVPFNMGGSPVGSFAAPGKLPYGLGGTARFIVRPVNEIDLFLEGSAYNFAYPILENGNELTNKNIPLLNASLGAGYNFPFGDRWALNASLKAGASFINSQVRFSAGASVGVSYRIRPAISIAANADASFHAAQIIPIGIAPGLVVNLSQLFNPNASQVAVQIENQEPVFPVLYSWYEYNSFGTISVVNFEDAKITNVKVSFYQPQYMNQPNLCAEIDELGKQEYFEAELTAFFNERMMDLTELTDTQAQIIIEYKYLGQKKTKTIPVIIPVYDRNSMNWADDRRAASFVSSKDPAALWFSKYITSVIRDNIRSGVPVNIQYAMGIFETLDQFGINYVIDPSSSYADKIGGDSVDFLQFPYQTLMYRGGDCDDLSILTCSLFEAVGIKTAFITVPGHIYMAFDTGVLEADAQNYFSDLSQVIINEGRVWMPLEVTISDEGFSKAWRVGAREWNVAAEQGEAMLYPMEDSWKVYRPVSVPGAQANFDMPDKKIVTKLFEHRVDEWVMRELEPSIQKYRNMLAKKYDKAVQNNLGVLYGRYGLFSEAEVEFKNLRKAGYIPAVVNTANIYFAKQSYNKALVSYETVLREEPFNVYAVLGASRCQWELGNYEESDRYYDLLKTLNPELAGEYLYLSSFTETKGRAYSLSDRLENMSWSMAETEEELARRKALEYNKSKEEKKVEKATVQMPVLESKSLETEELEEEPVHDQDLPDFFFVSLDSLVPDAVIEKETEEDSEENTEISENSNAVKVSYEDFALSGQDNNSASVKREVPRFNRSEASEWAPEEAYDMDMIPGMKTFAEEMGDTQNEKAFLYAPEEDDDISNFDVFGTDDIADETEKEVEVQEVNLKKKEVNEKNNDAVVFESSEDAVEKETVEPVREIEIKIPPVEIKEPEIRTEKKKKSHSGGIIGAALLGLSAAFGGIIAGKRKSNSKKEK